MPDLYAKGEIVTARLAPGVYAKAKVLKADRIILPSFLKGGDIIEFYDVRLLEDMGRYGQRRDIITRRGSDILAQGE